MFAGGTGRESNKKSMASRKGVSGDDIAKMWKTRAPRTGYTHSEVEPAMGSEGPARPPQAVY